MKECEQALSLYRNEFEHDACGIGFVAHMKGKKSHDIISRGLEVLENMMHRGAESADNKTGDGAGILIQIPRDFYLMQGYVLPTEGQFGTGIIFLPKDATEAKICEQVLLTQIDKENVELIGFRDVPVDNSCLGEIALSSEPKMKQIFIGGDYDQDVLERKLYIVRKKTENYIRNSELKQKNFFYIPSLSTKVLIYKGMFTSEQLGEYYLDLHNSKMQSAIALVHSRFSTNTFPTWDLAQPFRMLAHNGEINTVKGNRFWMQARESILKSDLLGDLQEIYPVIEPDKSDSASLDNMLEFLFMSGKTLPHALAMLIPESWNVKNPIPPELKAFYEYHSTIMEPWDGPASLVFSDGRYVGGMLDRNGLRPSRYLITNHDLIIMASETGVQYIEPSEIREKGKLRPGKMLLIDTLEGKIHYDPELKEDLAKQHPYSEWLAKNRITLHEIESGQKAVVNLKEEYDTCLKAFGYTDEDINVIIKPMSETGNEPVGSMGNDTPIAAISEKPHRLFTYFRQLFAQVTNPPIDPIREELVMSLTGYIGSLQKNLLDEVAEHCKMVKFTSPVINNTYFQIIKNLKYKGFSTVVLPMHFPVCKGENALTEALDELCRDAEKAVDEGKNYIIFTDRGIKPGYAAIPSLLAVSAVHHYLIDKRKRMQIDIVVETADAREVHHFALLFGYGASVVNPYLAFAVIENLVLNKSIQLDYQRAEENYIKAINKGLLKILSKMGISTLRSYRAAQIFEAVGINRKVVDKYFTGTVSRIGGIGMSEIAEETIIWHNAAYNIKADRLISPALSGLYAYRKEGEHHSWNPETIALLQWSTKTGDYSRFKEYTSIVNEETRRPAFLRGFFNISKNPIDISEVEPVEKIMIRFVTGAMSYGSISREAHETIAIAMNRIGGRSNTGEGGESPERYIPASGELNTRSAIKQVASGRFGVTAAYLVNADEIQIKIAQGAKPGEGGQLPGHKVDKIIAKTRHSIPGITLISPPPHHDIYSIEDLAQLIFDLRNVNPKALISVKLVSETGVGTIAAGVAKAKADLITISGTEGGTGASPVSSIKHAGLPLEMGLAETQQTLVLNNLRKYVKLQTDGQLKTGRDVFIAGLLGAEEFGFATSALVVLGCVLMRKCHLNTCPVGVATQDPELRKRFHGKADHLVNLFRFIAEEVRELLAETGFRRFDDIVGRAGLLELRKDINNKKASTVDLSVLTYVPNNSVDMRFTTPRPCNLEAVLDVDLIRMSTPAIDSGKEVNISRSIKNTDRTTGAMLSGNIASKYGDEGLPDSTIKCSFIGSAGQSFGAFLAHGVELRLEGDANDYLGKGLSGGRIIVVPPKDAQYAPEKNIIVGNTVLYGATSGEVFINGIAGERFCVRNSGATAVVEGAGDHCCEYMTGGFTVVLGKTGRNFAAGMSGGIAFVLNEAEDFDYYCNMGMVELSLVEDLHDIRELKAIISRHHYYTGSPLANRILNNWDEYLLKFIKVIPFEYKKVLQEEKLEALKQKIAEVDTDVDIRI